MPSSEPPIGIINNIVGALNTVVGLVSPVGGVITAPSAIITQVGAATYNVSINRGNTEVFGITVNSTVLGVAADVGKMIAVVGGLAGLAVAMF
jgi:hypothetical protein